MGSLHLETILVMLLLFAVCYDISLNIVTFEI